MEGVEDAGAARPAIQRDDDESNTPQFETLTLRLERLRAEKEALRQELEAEELEAEVNALRRMRDEGHTPAASLHPSLDRIDSDARSMRTESVSTPPVLASRPRLKEPKPFKGDTIKEARNFIRDLEVIFALTGSTYPTDREKVLYGVMYLAGEAHENWHQRHNISQLDNYSLEDFKDFVRNAVGDPVNRSISVTLQYDKARQSDGQTVQAFSTELDVLEDQMTPYTEPQRVRHLLAKLQPALRNAIIKFHPIPDTRQELVALASRMETTDRTGHSSGQKRSAPDSHMQEPQKKQQSSGRSSHGHRNTDTSSSQPKALSPFDKSQVECYGCHKKGHYKSECQSKHLWSGSDSHAVRKVAAEAAPLATEKGKGKGLAKDRN